MKYVYLIFTVLALSSCATVMNEKVQMIHFYSDTNKENLKIKDSIYSLPLDIQIPRSREDLKVDVLTDSRAVEYTVLSEQDPLFVFGNIIFPLGYIVDLNSDKRFYYKETIYLDYNNNTKFLGSKAAVYSKKRKSMRSLIDKKEMCFCI